LSFVIVHIATLVQWTLRNSSQCIIISWA